MKYTNTIGMLAASIFFIALLATSNVSADSGPAAEDTEDLNVSVIVSSQTWVDISPDHIRWQDVNPGADSVNFTETEHGTYDHEGITIRNIGSTDIKTVWFNASYPASLPYGTGALSNYDTANFVLLSKADIDGNNSAEMSDTDYYYINKKEYAEAERVYQDAETYSVEYGRNIPFLQTFHPTEAANVTIGRMRDGANEYYWALQEGDDGDCNSTNDAGTPPKFAIGLKPHNETTIGDIDLADSECEATRGTCEYIASLEGLGDGYYYGFLDNDTNRWAGSVVRLDTDCKGVSFVTWNKDYALDKLAIGGLADGSANYWLANTSTTYSGTAFPQGTNLADDTTSPEVLAPGEYYTGWLKLRLPWGVPEGTLNEGTITVLVSTSNPTNA